MVASVARPVRPPVRRSTMTRSRRSLQDDRGAIATGRASGRKAVSRPASLHLAREREDDARARRAEGVAERDGSAHDIQLLNGHAADAVALENDERRKNLRREGLVHLEHVDIVEG